MGMKKILLIQQDRCIQERLILELLGLEHVELLVAYSLEEADKVLQEQEDFFALVLDITQFSNDAEQIYDFVQRHQRPTFVMTPHHDSTLTRIMQSRYAFDYVIKESVESLRYSIKTLHRLVKNDQTKVLVVDDSDSDRKMMSMIVKEQSYQCYEARDGNEALEILKQEPKIKIIIADIHMPNMGGIELLKYVRGRKLQNELAIMGVSSDKQSLLRYMKLGANEFMLKPFEKDEFMARLNRLSETYEQIKELEELSSRDYLTRLRSRKYFMQEATPYIHQAFSQQKLFALAMIDIDNFKYINDTYGHIIGDQVLQRLAQILHGHFKGADIVARYGGEEFCVLLRDIDTKSAHAVMENLRKKVEEAVVRIVSVPHSFVVRFTISTGLNTQRNSNIMVMLEEADTLLYKAKKEGKNRVCINALEEGLVS